MLRRGLTKHRNSDQALRLKPDNTAEPADDITYPAGLLLFNRKDDIGETTNVAEQHAEKRDGLDGAARGVAKPDGQTTPRDGETKKAIAATTP